LVKSNTDYTKPKPNTTQPPTRLNKNGPTGTQKTPKALQTLSASGKKSPVPHGTQKNPTENPE